MREEVTVTFSGDRQRVGLPLKGLTKGLTLIELLIAISVSLMIAAALYFSLNSAVESWEVTQDQLILQHVLSSVMEELSEGMSGWGIRDGLEITEALDQKLSMVMPFSDDSHEVFSGVFIYKLARRMKPGTGIPIAEALLPGSQEYTGIPIRLIDPGASDAPPQVYLQVKLPLGTKLRLTYHPDPAKNPDLLVTFFYDAARSAVAIEDSQGIREISKNPFGVKIERFLIRYFDNANNAVGSNGSVSSLEMPRISGIEISLSAKSKSGNVREAQKFIAMRNAQSRTGNIPLKEGMRFEIPDSAHIKALLLTNFYGVDNEDTMVVLARPSSGEEWRVSLKFSKSQGLAPAVLDSYIVEYPPGNQVYADKPRVSLEMGLNLLSLGPDGRYDYDDDAAEDRVKLEGPVIFEVKRMSMTGASVLVRP